jgi:Flp pilus assembly protein TadD
MMSNDLRPGASGCGGFFDLPLRDPRHRLRLAAGALLIAALVGIVYWPALRGQFVWDDAVLVAKNPLATGELGLRSIWFQTDFPLSLVAFRVQWLLWGNRPAGYHAVNLLLHAMNSVLLWRLLRRLAIPGAWLASVLFAVHPVCVASAAWISEQKNTLSMVFYLLSIQWYLIFEDAQDSGPGMRATRWYWLSLGAFLVALFSKTSTVMLPVVLLGCAWWRRGRMTRHDFLRTGPFFVLALVFGCLTIWFQAHQAINTDTVQTEGFWGRLAGAGEAFWFYLGKGVLPVKLNLIYPRWQIDSTAAVSYVPTLLAGALFALCWRYRGGWGRPALFGLGCFAVTLFPVLGFFDMSFLMLSRVSDHFEYLPLASLAGLFAAALHRLLAPRHLRVAGIAVVLALSALTFQRARVFAAGETLWRDTLEKNPKAWAAQNNLGCVLAEQGKYDQAIDCFRASLRLNPRGAIARCNLGKALYPRGRPAEADVQFKTALKLKPGSAEIREAYASFLWAHGNLREAASQLRSAVQLRPAMETRLELATLLYQTGQFQDAAGQYRQILRVKPDSLESLNNLAWLLATCSDARVRDGVEAVRYGERACRLTGYKNARMLSALAAAYAERGDFQEAVGAADEALARESASGGRQSAAYRQLLQLYLSGRPYHEPPAPTHGARSN